MSGSPQTEDGYAPLSNEFTEALCAMPLKSARGHAVCLLVSRMTWGYKEKVWYECTAVELGKRLSVPRMTASDAVWEAIDKKVLINQPRRPKSMRLTINKFYRKWSGFPEDWVPSFNPKSAGTPSVKEEKPLLLDDYPDTDGAPSSADSSAIIDGTPAIIDGSPSQGEVESESGQEVTGRLRKKETNKVSPTPTPARVRDERAEEILVILVNVGKLTGAANWVMEWERTQAPAWEIAKATRNTDVLTFAAIELGKQVRKKQGTLRAEWALERFSDALGSYTAEPEPEAAPDRPTEQARDYPVQSSIKTEWSAVLLAIGQKADPVAYRRWLKGLGARVDGGELVVITDPEDEELTERFVGKMIGFYAPKMGLPGVVRFEGVDRLEAAP
jgi:phage replication O-like protein O